MNGLMSIACLLVPLFPLAARLRSEPDLTPEPVAVLEGKGNAARVNAATRPARKAGVRAGLTLPQARALLPSLITRERDPVSERAAQEALLDTAFLFSPCVESAGEGVAYLDVRMDARGLPRELGRSLAIAAGKAGLPVRVGIAGGKLTARIAAGLPGSPTIVPEGRQAAAAFLAPLPLPLLLEVGGRSTGDTSRPLAEIAETLSRWGIRTIGGLAGLPASQVAERLGDLGYELHEIARGVDPSPLTPHRAPESFSEGLDLDWPLVTLEPFLAMARSALERLTQRLSSEGLGCARLTVALRLDPSGSDGNGENGHDTRDIALPAPTRDVETLLTLARLGLESRPPGAPVTGFSITAHPDRPRRSQLTLFGPPEISPDRLATVLARLSALLGDERVGAPRTVDGHRPERCAIAPYAPPPAPLVHRPHRGGQRPLSLRVLRPPVPLEVIVEEAGLARLPHRPPRPAGDAAAGGDDAKAARILPFPERPDRDPAAGGAPPARDERPAAPRQPLTAPASPPRLLSIRPLPHAAAPPGVEPSGTVRAASASRRLRDSWWSAILSRDYWDVELTNGGIYRVYQERRSSLWFTDGFYD